MDLYTFGTPNGQKISIMLEELGVPYNVHKIDIMKGEQKAPAYLKKNPNGKIPTLVDGDTIVFETIAIMIYLAEKYGRFLPLSRQARYNVLEWCLFQASSVGPMLGQYGHFAIYAKEKIPYAIDRYAQEAQRIFGVLNTQLENQPFIAGHEYTIADMATWPWIKGYQAHYKAAIDETTFPHLLRWFKDLSERPAIQRGMRVP